MRRSLAPFLVFGALLATPIVARAMVVPLDHSERLRVPGSAASVVVGNPAIADVTVLDSHTMYVQARASGTTNIVVLDHQGRTLYSGEIEVMAKGSNVSVYRGGVRADVSCSPRCSGPSGAPAAGGVMGALADLMGGAPKAAGSFGAAPPGGNPNPLATAGSATP